MTFHQISHALNTNKLGSYSKEDLEKGKLAITQERKEMDEEIEFYGESEQRSNHLDYLEELENKLYGALARM